MECCLLTRRARPSKWDKTDLTALDDSAYDGFRHTRSIPWSTEDSGVNNCTAKEKARYWDTGLFRFFEVVWVLNLDDVRGLVAFGTFGHFKLDFLSLFQRPVTFALDCGVMHEDIAAAFTGNKTITFGVVKPLHVSCFHFYSFPFSTWFLIFGIMAGWRGLHWPPHFQCRFNANRPG